MKLEKKYINHITTGFSEMKSSKDLLDILNYTKTFIYGNKTVPFELKQLTFFTSPKRSKKAYTTFKVKKKSGAPRTINAPKKGLKALQKTLNVVLQCIFEPHKAATGFVMGKSIVDNAKVHVNSNYVYNLDLKDFFSSIEQPRVWSCLKLKPFNLIESPNKVLIDDDSRNFTLFVNNRKPEVLEKNFKFYVFRGKHFLEGRHHLKMTNNKEIVYYIVGSTSRESGTVKILTEFSDFDFINELAQKLVDTHDGLDIDLDLAIEFVLCELIGNHQLKLFKKDSRLKLANIISSLCCTEMEVERMDKDGNWSLVKKSVLPQGAPTSPMLSNVVCQRLDFLLTGVANRFGLRYTRYADDITFSSMHNVYQKNGEFLKELNRIISDQGFHIKESKTRLQKTGHRKEVTGLLVNEGVNVQKRYVKQLRMWLYYWEKYGYEKASEIFKQQYLSDKGLIKKGTPSIKNVIGGKLDYLKMVKGANNPLYLKLKIRFDLQVDKMSSLDSILNIWEKEGVEKAMEIYKTESL